MRQEAEFRNQQVAGSTPAGGSIFSLKTRDFSEASDLKYLHFGSNCAKTLHAASPVPEPFFHSLCEFPESLAFHLQLHR